MKWRLPLESVKKVAITLAVDFFLCLRKILMIYALVAVVNNVALMFSVNIALIDQFKNGTVFSHVQIS